MNDNELDQYEQEILNSFEKGEWVSVGDKHRLEEIQFYAKNTLDQEDKLITLKLSSPDWEAIQAKAIEDGIPYQTLISSILHQYATGRLVDERK
ncbi:hypothetical protein [Gloeocapsa sp. PCC 73106]|uniref:hypothetical protein n=1 Tax=Gloeocapsa sp. PCC 73106 TaxID=102232 RepID=UPI0002ACEF74|nr:hypothetical protein [Gloeocapsa sp. PCC 73106]ELR96376.1 hypothetical protein GLO73106DRAFT_00001680 [Gloeocapsa sp. PCC 73106]